MNTNTIAIIRTVILSVGWPLLVAGSIYLFAKGSQVYRMVEGSLLGKITKVLVFTMLIEMYSLGIVTTAYMFCNAGGGLSIGIPIFLVWFAVFAWSMKTLIAARNEIYRMTHHSDTEKAS